MKIPLKSAMPSSSGGIGGSSGNLNQGIKSPTTTAATPVNTSQVKSTPKQVGAHRNAVTQNNSAKKIKPQSAAQYGGIFYDNSQSLNNSKEQRQRPSSGGANAAKGAHLSGKLNKQTYKKPQI